MSFVSVRTRENFSPARNVRSTTAPLSSPFSLVRTNAPPLPGFTCWKSTIRHTLPSSSMCIPFLKLFVSTVSATKPRGPVPLLLGATRLSGGGDELLREPDRVLDPVLGHDHVVLDPDPEAALEVDAGLDGDDVARRERVGALRREPRRLVDVEAEAVPETVAERAREVAALDDVPRGRVDLHTALAGADRVEPRLLRREH